MNLNDSTIQTFVLIAFLALLPSILIMFTSFTRIVVVLSFLRQAIGTQQVPPNQVIVGLSIFLTFFIMGPTIDVISSEAIKPYLNKEINFEETLKRAEKPIKIFMLKHARQKDIALFLNISKEKKTDKPEDLSLRIIAPAFAISELKSAFEMGFLLFLPFLIIDLVVASILLSMGIMMLPPPLVSLPFKLLLFVLVDGWNLITGALVRSFH